MDARGDGTSSKLTSGGIGRPGGRSGIEGPLWDIGALRGVSLVDGGVLATNWAAVRGFFVSGIITIVVNLDRPRERRVMQSGRLAGSPL